MADRFPELPEGDLNMNTNLSMLKMKQQQHEIKCKKNSEKIQAPEFFFEFFLHFIS